MAEYTQVSDGLEVRNDRLEEIKNANTVIFDIDGVLIDVKGSFRETIRETVQFYLKKNYDLDSRQKLVAPEDIHLVKMAGKFNNDWDLAEGLLAYYVDKLKKHKIKDLQQLREMDVPFKDFIKKVGAQGGGLQSVYAVLFQDKSEEEQEALKKEIKRTEIEHIFQEVYAGTDYCQQLYMHRPNFFRGSGKIENEKYLLDPAGLNSEAFNYGVLTGRNKGETEMALERTGIHAVVDPDAVVYDDGTLAPKPDPAGLVKITDFLLPNGSIYCGDVVDDWRVVKNYHTVKDTPMYFCYCLTGTFDDATLAFFKGEGVDMIAQEINHLLAWLNSIKKEKN